MTRTVEHLEMTTITGTKARNTQTPNTKIRVSLEDDFLQTLISCSSTVYIVCITILVTGTSHH